MKSSLKNMVLVLFSITAISAFLVALVNNVTKDVIAKTEQENKDKAKLEVLPAAQGAVTYEEMIREIGDFKIVVTKVLDDGELLGYAVEAPSITRGGYADRIYLMVGFVEDEAGVTIHGVKVLSQKETPGLGAEMIKPGNKLEKSILGKSAETLTFDVTKNGGSFDALTGSTISSRAYANAVDTAYAGYLWATGKLGGADSAETTEESQSAETTEDEATCDTATGATKSEETPYEDVAESDDQPAEQVESVDNNEKPVAQEGENINE